MPTVINNPGTTEDSGSNLVLGVILVMVILGGFALFFIYGVPMIQNNKNPDSTDINITVPPATTPTTQTPAQ
ncbi:MAG: hypothetical protein A3C50_01520 [Candidatus Staskawiczbacteria bacterium RIFCSPHIGHO2_02_FULL_43_16]|uniref:Uncharacterized protein n=1 Tax=Candidatus Staskawiczbacteria bacterium RIFCSPHIGHO2_01_FULL_41_41 TaxID=1802203 RepID=A0A1G2HVC0_9BACT|nr:MAG: hypothetical protein A2822_03935 [Candidatus Staskawiczbacteria bacterium RIFCSPHIGHO2_01_FULL_41_41]OGZ69059.1 MAG: hypothetical protein A3C50_01520 [Candidatus Staskawiczbacteria bacterium RIFCSPHIGHO2_02_FULL_43_16]OGZ74514.1 MAG: hypothetical protein A3A12_01970 [Candidatus Staskawiczbacteria bacterium RIFCSPLOWO2_01_FULL_43_17b]